ncbi:kinesin-like protein KIN-10C [Nymphaea colorata]|nr:kinesin-like protein KIN-10C [Nymphaea colorata]
MATPISNKHLPAGLMESKVRVVVRIRPFLQSEMDPSGKEPLPCVSSVMQEDGSSHGVDVHLQDQFTSRNECYRLDFFYGQDSEVGQIFNRDVSRLLPGVLRGDNATVFAYGATGSGKTYTMQGTDEHPGLMPLTMSSIMSMCEMHGYLLDISYYEVYLDRCYDLLEPKMKEVSVLEDRDGKIQLKGLSQIPIRSIEEFRQVFSQGIQRRKVGHTGLNDVSSRSHGILMVSVSKTEGLNTSLVGKINLIDLAGNEDNRRSCNDGIRLQESVKINQSLFALSNVIYALNSNQARIPYRESKLTRILQDSLGGTSRALMIACLNPASYQEAVHTVSLAARSRQIVNYVAPGRKQETPREKVDMEAKLRAWLESKGKTKATPVSSAKKVTSFKSSGRVKLANKMPSDLRGRKLFEPQTAGPLRETAEDNCSTNFSAIVQIPESQKEKVFLESSSSMTSVSMDCCVFSEAVLYLKDDDGYKCMETTHHNKEVEVANESNFWMPLTAIVDQFMDKENLMSPTATIQMRAQQSPSRNVLSPVNTNISGSILEDTPHKPQANEVPRHSKAAAVTVPRVLNHDDDDDEALREGTPLDKFHAQGSSLKNSLIKGYLKLLNTASREELMGLKGIGQKRADYILNLREQSPQPIKTLYDLEKIGMSSKQVEGMFKRAARSFFT